MRYHTKFRQNWSNGRGDMAIFLFLKMAVVRYLGFSKSYILMPYLLHRSQMHYCAKFCQNGQTEKEIGNFSIFTARQLC